MESTESEEQKEKGMKTSEESLWDLWEINKQITYALWDSQKEKTERRGQRKYLKKQWLKVFQI